VNGHVSRIDPSVVNGTVTVDVTITDPLPNGARPDLSVMERGDLEHKDVLYVGRPVHGKRTARSEFSRSRKTIEATRVNVKLGRSSVNTVEIWMIEGRGQGDPFDMSRGTPLTGALEVMVLRLQALRNSGFPILRRLRSRSGVRGG